MALNQTNLQLERVAEWLFKESAAGIQITGDSGSGKSNAMEVLAQSLARANQAFIYIDPHGTSAKQVEQFVWNLPLRQQRNFLVIRPADISRMVSMNPLAVPRDGLSDLEWQARLTTKVGHVARILLAAWGELTFNGRPRMFTWTTRILKSLARCGLTIPDAKYFLDVGGEVYQSLVRVIPDLMARSAFEDLAERNPSGIDEQLESTRTRMLGFLENGVVEATLGRADATLDMAQVVRDGVSIIVDLEPRGMLREEDQNILANLILTEFIFTVMNLPEPERRPYFCFVDELPVFAAASGPLLQKILCEIRKFKSRFVLAHQGTQRFPERTDDPFLNTIVSQCGVHLFLRHVNPVDARYFGDIIAMPTLDPMRIKHEQHQDVQYQGEHELVTLVDTSTTVNDGEQIGFADGVGDTSTESWDRSTSDTDGVSEGESSERSSGSASGNSSGKTATTQRDEDLLRRSVSEAASSVSNTSNSSGTSQGTTHGTSRSSTVGNSQGGSRAQNRQQSVNVSRNRGRSTGRTIKQTLVPKTIIRDVVTSVQFFGLDEQQILPAVRLAQMPTGAAILYVSGRGAAEITFPLAKSPFPRMPKAAARKRAQFRRLLHARPEYEAPEAILAARQSRLTALLRQIDQAGLRRAQGIIEQSSSPRLEDKPLSSLEKRRPAAEKPESKPPWSI